MTKKKENPINELIISYGTEVIGNRFMVKVSKMDTGVSPESFLVTTQDLLERAFSMKFFRSKEEVALFLKLLTIAAK